VGFVMAASTLTGVFLKLPAGAMSDLLGRRRLLIAGALVFATLPFTYLAVSTLTWLVIVRFLHGSATAVFSPVASASLSDIAPANRRATWLTTYSTAQGTGQVIGPILAGYLIAADQYDLAFALSGLIGLGVPLVVATWRGEATETAVRPSWQAFLHGVAEVARDRLVLITSLAHAGQFVLNGMLNAFLPLYALEVLNLSGSALGWLFGVQTVTTLLVRPLIGLLSDRVGRRIVIVTGLMICSAAVFSLSLVSGLPSIVVVMMSYAAGVGITTAATSAFITDITRRARYGAAHGVFGTIYDVGDALGPLAGGVLVAVVGYARMFQLMAAVAVMMTLVFAISTARHANSGPPHPFAPPR
jgi:MFS family permease